VGGGEKRVDAPLNYDRLGYSPDAPYKWLLLIDGLTCLFRAGSQVPVDQYSTAEAQRCISGRTQTHLYHVLQWNFHAPANPAPARPISRSDATL